MGDEVRIRTGVEFYPGKVLDILEPLAKSNALALLWHGSGPNEREVLRPLARAMSGKGLAVIVPDWDSTDLDGGRAHLEASLAYASEFSSAIGVEPKMIAGWSLGASAGLDYILHSGEADGWSPVAFLGIAGGYESSPMCTSSDHGPVRAKLSIPVTLVHGAADEIVPVEMSRAAVARLEALGAEVELRVLDTDHAGVIGTRYEPTLHRCVPLNSPEGRRVVDVVASFAIKMLEI